MSYAIIHADFVKVQPLLKPMPDMTAMVRLINERIVAHDWYEDDLRISILKTELFPELFARSVIKYEVTFLRKHICPKHALHCLGDLHHELTKRGWVVSWSCKYSAYGDSVTLIHPKAATLWERILSKIGPIRT